MEERVKREGRIGNHDGQLTFLEGLAEDKQQDDYG